MAEEQVFELRPARISERFLAYVLDLAPFMAGYAFCFSRLRVMPHGAGAGARMTLEFLGGYFLYQLIGNLFGATPGKWLMGVRVIGTDGKSLGLVRSALRAAGYFLSTPLFNFGFIIALFHPQSRALHDLISGTAVVELKPKASSEAALIFAAALCLIALIFGGSLYLSEVEPTPSDTVALARAQKALAVLGQIEETYKAGHGTYTASLRDLAYSSGDVQTFKDSLTRMFVPDDFVIEADAEHYRIEATLAGSWPKTVSIDGPSSEASSRPRAR